MNRVTFITQFIAYFPDDSESGRRELTHAIDQISALGFGILRQAPYLLAVTAPVSPTPTGQSEMLLDIFPGTAASKRIAAANFNVAQSAEDVHGKAETSAQCYNLLQSRNTDFVLESDMLGLKPVHTARTSGGDVLGSRIADLLSLFPELAEPTDTVALYELLGLWAPLAGRTLHQKIRRTLPGGCYRWTPGTGLSGRRSRDLQPTTVEPCKLMDETIEAIHSTTGQSLLEKTAGAAQPILLALSGGFDSRLIAALCRDLHIDIRARGYGRRHHKEWRSTQAVAQALDLKLKMVRQDKDATLRYLPNHLDATEGTADSGSVSIMNLLGSPSTPGSTILHGFCGDVLSGGRISDLSASNFVSREATAEAIIRYWYPPSASNLQKLFTPVPDLDAVRQDVLDGLKTDCPPYQAYLLWFAENRNRRYVATHFAVLGEHFDVAMPFYDRRLVHLWFSLPPIGLTDRFVFRKLLVRYYPGLARIPHSEDAAPISPNLRWQLARLYYSLPRRALAGCIGSKRARKLLLSLYRGEDFRSLSKLAAPQQQAYMLSQLAQLHPVLKEELGVELSPGYETVLSGNLQALRALFTVANYAQRRHG